MRISTVWWILAGAAIVTAAGSRAEADGPAAPELVARVDRAVRDWEKSCTGPQELGLCSRTRLVTGENRCSVLLRSVAVYPRRAAPSRRKELAAALEALEQAGSLRADPAAAAAVARARFALAEARYEDFLRLSFPTGLDFSRHRSESERRFRRFMDDFKRRLDHTLAGYRAVTEYPDVPGVPVALEVRGEARVAQALSRAVEILRGAEVPADLRRGEYAAEATGAYCDEIWKVAAPLEERARAAFDRCFELAKAADLQDAWTVVCAAGPPAASRVQRRVPRGGKL